MSFVVVRTGAAARFAQRVEFINAYQIALTTERGTKSSV
jgi:hypothetical protein